VDINFAGKRVRGGAAVRVVGTFSLKSVFYEDLWKLGTKSGKSSDPPGMCHFPDFIDDVYFRQLTSEYVVNEMGRRGRPRRVWRLRHGRDNHLLDCRVYNLALAEYLGLQKMTSDEWAMLARERGAPGGEEPWKAASMAGVDGQDTDGEASVGEAEVAAIAPEGRKLAWREAVDKFKTERISG
jgi:phage terminase large subunit GpA-like protein